MSEVNVTEIKTLNGYPLADTKARADIATLSEEVVKSINGVKPDANGNVQIAGDGSGVMIDATLLTAGAAADAAETGKRTVYGTKQFNLLNVPYSSGRFDTSGADVASTYNERSDYIKIDRAGVYLLTLAISTKISNNKQVAFYDADKQYIGGCFDGVNDLTDDGHTMSGDIMLVHNAELPIPDGAVYFRFYTWQAHRVASVYFAEKMTVPEALAQIDQSFEQKTADLQTKVDAIAPKTSRRIMKPFIYPETFSGTYKPVTVFYDGNTGYTDFAEHDFKPAASRTIYISPDGDASADGSSESLATTMEHAQTLLSNGLTGVEFILAPGRYFVSNRFSKSDSSFSLIGNGAVVFVDGEEPVFTQNDGYWTATQANAPAFVLDSANLDIALVASDNATPAAYGYHYADGVLTVNVPYNPNGRIVTVRNVTEGFVRSLCKNKDAQVYVENITIVGGKKSLHVVDSEAAYTSVPTLVANNVKCMYAISGAFASGGRVLLNKVEAMYCLDDGISYNMVYSVKTSQYIEIDCVSANNGEAGEYNTNGSTAHGSAKGVRVNCVYYNCQGPNLADTDNCESVLIGCESYDSAQETDNNTGFYVGAGSKMWLYGCNAHDNKNDLVAADTTTMYTHRTKFETKYGLGTFEDIAY